MRCLCLWHVSTIWHCSMMDNISGSVQQIGQLVIFKTPLSVTESKNTDTLQRDAFVQRTVSDLKVSEVTYITHNKQTNGKTTIQCVYSLLQNQNKNLKYKSELKKDKIRSWRWWAGGCWNNINNQQCHILSTERQQPGFVHINRPPILSPSFLLLHPLFNTPPLLSLPRSSHLLRL